MSGPRPPCRHSPIRGGGRGELRGRMFPHHSSSQWQPIIRLPMELIIDNVSVSISVFFFSCLSPSLSQGGGSLQLRASRKEGCLTEFKVCARNSVIASDFRWSARTMLFLSREKAIGWNVSQRHSERLLLVAWPNQYSLLIGLIAAVRGVVNRSSDF